MFYLGLSPDVCSELGRGMFTIIGGGTGDK